VNHSMQRDSRMKIRRAAIGIGIIAIALVAVVCAHLCLHPLSHSDDAGSSHFCPLCAVFSSTSLNFTSFDLLPAPVQVSRPLFLTKLTIEESPGHALTAVRACLWRIIRRWIIPKTDFSGAGDFASIAS
jgi:hypothetical protein